ncbi:unnamed protein product [Leptidea sinapis]|uniref:Uncharacterized protein n=1 Tax=Leptidea sinapis TaxID=189913 RepID=A0A5E4R2H3_9NEOP|nr:unnamed protein product [Leptidea sinapis]
MQENVDNNRDEMLAFYKTLINQHRFTLEGENANGLIEKAKVDTSRHEEELFEGRNHEIQLLEMYFLLVWKPLSL